MRQIITTKRRVLLRLSFLCTNCPNSFSNSIKTKYTFVEKLFYSMDLKSSLTGSMKDLFIIVPQQRDLSPCQKKAKFALLLQKISCGGLKILKR